MRLPNVGQYCIVLILVFNLSVTNLFGEDVLPPNLSVKESDSLPNTTEPVFESTMENVPTHFSCPKIYRLGIDYRPEYVLQTNGFVRGDYSGGKQITQTHSAHLRFAFGFAKNTLPYQLYHNVYQGIGVSCQTFDNSRNLGNPFSLYLFQGARLFSFNSRLSFNYEWNFGLTFGWKPYDYETNPYNIAIGSPVSAYMNLNFSIDYHISPELNLITGASVTHFSNGNTQFPNAGLNTFGLRIGLVYSLYGAHKEAADDSFCKPITRKFQKHLSYDCVLFGAWKRKGIAVNDENYLSPEAYPVMGFNYAGMYNLSYIFRAGLSLDAVYDQSANIYLKNSVKDNGYVFQKTSFDKQTALGVSARSELMMPYFSVNIGMGANFLGKGDLKGTYQMLILKIETFRSSFIHIGYNLKDFHTPNYLMLGVGYRFHDKYPRIYRK